MRVIENSLARIGLTGTLAKVYMACIGLGTVPVARIVAQADLPKATVYDALERLQREGLVAISADSRHRQVSAVDPSVLMEMHEARRQRLQETLPLLKAMFHSSQGKPNIRFYEGPEGVDTALWESLSGDASELLSCFSMEDLDATPGMARMGKYVAERLRRGKHLSVIRTQAKDLYPIWPTSHAELREVRYTPPGMVLAMTFVIYGNSVALISSGQECYGLVIDSAEYASLMRAMYAGIWHMCAPTPYADAHTALATGTTDLESTTP